MDADEETLRMANARADSVKPFAEEGYAIMGAAFEVHRELGGGLLEEIYQQALEIEFELREIPYLADEELRIYYKTRLLRKWYVPDFLAYGRVLVEIKFLKQLIPEHEAQLINYMRITRQPVGYLINFGPIAKVEWKRFILSEFIDQTADGR
jgi:GxxExxY protein